MACTEDVVAMPAANFRCQQQPQLSSCEDLNSNNYAGRSRTEQWLHSRLEGFWNPELAGVDSLVIFSIHDICPPATFRHIWRHAHSEDLSEEEANLVIAADVVLIIMDIYDNDHQMRAAQLMEHIDSLGTEGAPTVIVPHSTFPAVHSEADEWLALQKCLDIGVEDIIVGEPCGMRLACEIRSKVMQQQRGAAKLNADINSRRSAWCHTCHLHDSIHETVWVYLRMRLHTKIPPRTEDISAGVPLAVNNLAVGDVLGRGRFGTVCKLEHPESPDTPTGEVLKMLDKKNMTSFEGICFLSRHIDIMEALSCRHPHPNIAKLYEVYHTETHILFRLEDGGSYDLNKRLKLRDSNTSSPLYLNKRKAAAIMTQCMDALCHIHSGPLVAHLDLKPENIIVSEIASTDSITIKLADFGAAKVVKPGSLSTGAVGTFPFMAPEMLFRSMYDPFKADIWSMGIVFLELLCSSSSLDFTPLTLGPRRTEQPLTLTKAETLKRDMMKIWIFFLNPCHVKCSLEIQIQPELRNLLDDCKILLVSMLNLQPDERWTAADLLKASKAMFAADVSEHAIN